MNEQQELEIAQGLRQGKPDAWRALYDAFAVPVWNFVARRLGPSSADVADVVQETILAAARSARSYDPAQGSLWNWLTGIARRHVALHFRQRQRQDRWKQGAEGQRGVHACVVRWLEDGQAMPTEALASAEIAMLVRTTLAGLSDDYEDLLTSKYLDGATVQQIAARRSSSETAVRSRLARARQAFRQAFTARTVSGQEK